MDTVVQREVSEGEDEELNEPWTVRRPPVSSFVLEIAFAALYLTFYALSLYHQVGGRPGAAFDSAVASVVWCMVMPWLVRGSAYLTTVLLWGSQQQLITERILAQSSVSQTEAVEPPPITRLAFSGTARVLFNGGVGCAVLGVVLPLLWRMKPPSPLLFVSFGTAALICLVASFVAQRHPDFRLGEWGIEQNPSAQNAQLLSWGEISACEIETQFNGVGDIERRDIVLADTRGVHAMTLQTRKLSKRQMAELTHILRWQLRRAHPRVLQTPPRSRHRHRGTGELTQN